MNYAYEQADQAHRDKERERLLRNLNSAWSHAREIAGEVGEYARQVFFDLTAEELAVTLTHLTLKQAEFAKAVEKIEGIERELGER